MIQQHNLGVFAFARLHQHIAWVGVAVHIAIDKDHLRVEAANLLGDIMCVNAVGHHVGAIVHLATLTELHGQNSLGGEGPLYLRDLRG